MFRYLIVAGILMSGSALAMPSYDIRSNPLGVSGSAPLNVDGNDAGRPIIHRPEAGPANSISNGVGSLRSGVSDQDKTVTYTGPSRGTFGSATSPTIVTNEDGRPQLRYSN